MLNLARVVNCSVFFHNLIARRASTIIDRFRHQETGRESFHSFFRDIIEARLFANGLISWNEMLIVSPSTTPEITTPLNELNYWKSVSFFLIFFLFHVDYKLHFFRKCFFVLKFGRKITGLLEAAAEKYPSDPSVVPVTIGELHSLEETLMWRWVGFFEIVHDKVVYLFDFSYDLLFSFCSKYTTELQKITNTVVGKFVTVEE